MRSKVYFCPMTVRREWNGLLLCALLGLGCADKTDTKTDSVPDAAQVPDGGGDAGTRDPDRLRIEKGFFRDGAGRALILRGVNARVEGVFDVTFDDGRVPVEDVPELTSADCRRMSELGLSLLRLPINWSGIEPERDKYNEAYLERVDAAVACATEHQVYVLIDLHQDAYSKEIGEDGAPLWAIVPPPTKLLEGPLSSNDLLFRRASKAVLDASASFFAKGDPNKLQAEFLDMLAMVAKRYAAQPFVLGIDVYNEPVASSDLIASFNKLAGEAVRKVAPDLTVVFEPDALWSANGGLPVTKGPYPLNNALYGPHLYGFKGMTGPTREGLLPAFETAAREAKAWGTPWFVGEFGSGPLVNDFDRYLKAHYDLQDEFLVSSALWLWKEGTQGSWGLYDLVEGSWQERPAMVALVSRPHAQRIAGTPSTMRLESDTLSFAYDAAIDVANQVFIPERYQVDKVRCDGAEVTPRIKETRVEVTCKAGKFHTVDIAFSAK